MQHKNKISIQRSWGLLITTQMFSQTLTLLNLIDLNNSTIRTSIPLLSSSVTSSVRITSCNGSWIVGCGGRSAGTENWLAVVEADETSVEVGCGAVEVVSLIVRKGRGRGSTIGLRPERRRGWRRIAFWVSVGVEMLRCVKMWWSDELVGDESNDAASPAFIYLNFFYSYGLLLGNEATITNLPKSSSMLHLSPALVFKLFVWNTISAKSFRIRIFISIIVSFNFNSHVHLILTHLKDLNLELQMACQAKL